eukprot:TRINITY_DN2529_c0_g1_i8.p1 TRINITY_DN2529_c0_g1~~TRINITY_DN2529_c0_g1_i8.p1  ORF type:complete len:423 (+),score=33.48 TRINITY_DN2529_c0_g1_i8:84-1352(+)
MFRKSSFTIGLADVQFNHYLIQQHKVILRRKKNIKQHHLCYKQRIWCNHELSSWDYSPEWWGCQGGSWGKNNGEVVFKKLSRHGNGEVTVTSHPSSLSNADWRVLRFNKVTRQSVALVNSTKQSAYPTCLAFEYLKTMAACVLTISQICEINEKNIIKKPVRLLFVGLGGGSLPLFVQNLFVGWEIVCVEIDPVVVEAATEFMGFQQQDNQIRIVQQSIEEYLTKLQDTKFDFIIIDAFDGQDQIPKALWKNDDKNSCIQYLNQHLKQDTGALIMNVHGGTTNTLNLYNKGQLLFKLGQLPGFDPESLLGSQLLDIFFSLQEELLKNGGEAFTISTRYQDNIILVYLVGNEYQVQQKEKHRNIQGVENFVKQAALSAERKFDQVDFGIVNRMTRNFMTLEKYSQLKQLSSNQKLTKENTLAF